MVGASLTLSGLSGLNRETHQRCEIQPNRVSSRTRRLGRLPRDDMLLSQQAALRRNGKKNRSCQILVIPERMRSLPPGPITRRPDRCSSHWITRNAQRRSAAPFLLECGRQAGELKHLDGRAIIGKFKLGGSEAQNLSAITFTRGALGLSRDLQVAATPRCAAHGIAGRCHHYDAPALNAARRPPICADGVGDLNSLMRSGLP